MSNLVDNCMELGFGMMRLPRIEGTNDIDLGIFGEMKDYTILSIKSLVFGDGLAPLVRKRNGLMVFQIV